jgi:F-type H+-transporting ATPase subunit d
MALQKAVADMREAVDRAAYKSSEPDFKAMRKDTKMPEIVDEFEKAYKGVTKPDTKSPEIEALRSSFVEIEAEAKSHAAHATKRIAELDVELKAIQEQRAKLGSMTMDEYFETDPEMKKKIDDKIKNDQWFEV